MDDLRSENSSLASKNSALEESMVLIKQAEEVKT